MMFKISTLLILVFVSVVFDCSRNQGESEQEEIIKLPGVSIMDKNLLKQIDKMKLKRGPSYRPRTRHLNKDGSAQFTNRLFLETSPYLNQHAHNPVNWYPWGEEAFTRAREKNRPILVSIGYSTCHWCHVMEEESFEDIGIAGYLNENFVAIKIDREERPDIDSVYMKAVQAMGLNGGWPLNVFLTPDLKPFYGGTYFPARDGDRGASMGFLTLLHQIKLHYSEKRDQIEESGNTITNFLKGLSVVKKSEEIPDDSILMNALSTCINLFDSQNGGIGGAPKFPSSLPISLLFRLHRKTGNEKALEMALKTLDEMRGGGLYDQVGGGFHRYSVDSHWLVPHFEKMLYDNALLVLNYTDAYQATGEERYRETVFEVLDYIIRDMQSEEGGFYSATDADSLNSSGEREEGYYFTWSVDEIKSILDKEAADIILDYYNVTDEGNFEGRNIFHLDATPDTFRQAHSLERDELLKKISLAKDQLLQERNRRDLPIRDEKIITAWNGLMISAFAKASFVFNEKRYLEEAEKAASFILENRFDSGKLFRSYKDGQVKHEGFLSDYTFFTASLIDLYEASFNPEWLKKSIEIQHLTDDLFEDKSQGGYYMTDTGNSDLLTREKPGTDGAIPSGNSIALMNLLRLGAYTQDDRFRIQAENLIKVFANDMEKNPVAFSEMLLAMEFYQDKPKEIILVFQDSQDDTGFIDVLRRTYLPNKVVSILYDNNQGEESNIIPLTRGKVALGGKSTAYVCELGVCRLPVFSADDFRKELLRK